MPKIVVYQTAPVWFVKNEYFMAKIDVYRSLLPSDRVIGWDMKMMSHLNSNASFINIWDRLIVGSRRFENLWTGLLIEENRTESGYPTSEADENLTVPDITEWLGMRTAGTV